MLDGVVAPPATVTSAKRKPAGRVVLHVGAPKTGTTYLQNVLWRNRTTLAEDGVLYPLRRPLEHFDATMDIREMEWEGVRRPEWDGAWNRLTTRVRSWSGPTAVISNEMLGGATVEQIGSVVDSLRPAEVAVVFTARDLARQLPSSWQENVKHRLRVTFEKYVDDLVELGHDAPGPWGERFWSQHHAVEVLARWAQVVPRENIHVVTVPQLGAPKELLWHRFAQVLGIDGRDYDTDVAAANSSLGVAQAELLRRVNAALPDEALGRHSDPLIRVALGENILARAGENAPRVKLPASRLAWVTEWSQQLIDELRDAGYDVVGDLAELMPVPHETPPPQPEDVSAAELLPAAIAAITGLLERLGSERDEVARLRYRLDKPFKAWLTRRHPRVADFGRRMLGRGR